MAGPLRPKPLPPSSLMAVKIMERWEKKFQKKFFFPSWPCPLPPPPLLMAWPLREDIFCGFPYIWVFCHKTVCWGINTVIANRNYV